MPDGDSDRTLHTVRDDPDIRGEPPFRPEAGDRALHIRASRTVN